MKQQAIKPLKTVYRVKIEAYGEVVTFEMVNSSGEHRNPILQDQEFQEGAFFLRSLDRLKRTADEKAAQNDKYKQKRA